MQMSEIVSMPIIQAGRQLQSLATITAALLMLKEKLHMDVNQTIHREICVLSH